MKRLMVVFVCVVAVAAAGTSWAEPYRILHKQGAVYTLDSGWTMTTPPYYPGVEWAVDLVADSEGVTILHKDGAMWSEAGGWDMNTPPYYPGSNYAQALDAGPEEVRIPISALPYEITQSGSYYITGDLTVSGTGITVSADNVTIDLMGYSLIGPGIGANHGIYMNGRSNVEVRNGTITNFGSDGIYEQSPSATNHRIINMRVVGNEGCGIVLNGHVNLVKDCTASDNNGHGISAGSGSTVTCNTAYDNSSDGIRLLGSSTVTGNTACYNQHNGIFASNSLLDANTAYDNNQSGGAYENISCTSCTLGTNHNPAIE